MIVTPLRVEQAAFTAVLARRDSTAARPSFCNVVFMVLARCTENSKR